MTTIFHIGDPCRESSLEQALFDDGLWKGCVMDFVAVFAGVRPGTVFFGVGHDLNQLGRLNDLRCYSLSGDIAAVAFRARWTMRVPALIDFLVTEGGALMLRMTGLPTGLVFRPFARFFLRRLGHVRRGWFAGRRRILF